MKKNSMFEDIVQESQNGGLSYVSVEIYNFSEV